MLRRAKDKSYKAKLKIPDDIAQITESIINDRWLEQFRLAGAVENLLQNEKKTDIRKIID